MITRRLIVMTPVLLIAGIVAQIVLLAAAVVVFVPCLIWPRLLDKPYRWITYRMARIMTRSMLSKRSRENSERTAIQQ